MTYGFALHTASPELGLAISNFSGDTRCQTWDLGRGLATDLHLLLAEFIQPLTWADLGFLAVARGPGGFTGTRLGVVTARTLAQQLEIPVFAISTLGAVAWQARQHIKGDIRFVSSDSVDLPETDIALQMPAQRGQFFVAIYSFKKEPSAKGTGLVELLADTVMSPESWQETLAAWSNPYQLIEVQGGLGASVSSVLELAYLEFQEGKLPHWSEALPYYGQHPVEGK